MVLKMFQSLDKGVIIPHRLLIIWFGTIDTINHLFCKMSKYITKIAMLLHL